MNLSAKLILYKLRQHFSITASNRISANPCLKYPVLYQSSLPLKDNLIYVIDDPNFILHSHNLKNVLLIFVGDSFKGNFQNIPNVCKIDSDISTAWVFQVLQEIFQIYNEWAQDIFSLMSSAPTVQKLLELSMDAITNPLAVTGMDFTIIGSTDERVSNLKNHVFGSNEETLPVVNALKSDENYINATERTGFFYYPGNDYALPSICVNIHSHGKTEFRLLVMPGDMPLDDTIGFLAEFLASCVEQIIHSALPDAHSTSHSLHQVFLTMLTDPKADYVTTSHELSACGWLVTHYYQCMYIRTGGMDYKNLTVKSICNYIENMIPEACALELQGNIVVYFNVTLSELSLDQIMQKMTAFIRDNLLTASYSRLMMGHFNFYRQYQQAKITLQLSSQKNPTKWIHHFNDIALTYCLDQITRKLPAYMVCHEKLLQLKYQDENNDSQLYQTLRCFLENHQSATKTAQALFIHRSTLLYRLDRIRSFLKSDLSDPAELLYLLLSYQLMDEEE